MFDELGEGVAERVGLEEGKGDSVFRASGSGDGVLETLLAGVGVGDADGVGVGAAAAPFGVVLIVGKTAPFRIFPANRMKSKQAKMPPYRGESIIPLHPFVRAARLKRASPSVGAA